MTFWKNYNIFGNSATGKWLTIIVLGTIILIGTIIRFDQLDARAMGHVEIYVPGIELPEDISDPPPRLTLWKTLTGSMWEPHPPAGHISMWPWTKLFGSGLFIIRLPSVLFGVAAILLIYVLGTLEEDRLTALLGAGLLAFNGHHILWSQIARPYSMACFLGLLSTLLLLLVARKEHRRRLFLWLYLVITLYGLSTTYYFWILFATHIFWVLLNSFAKKTVMSGLFRSQLFILILASPLVTLAIFQSRITPSHLGANIFHFFREFLQFGFLFESDIDALIQNPLPTIVRFSLPFFALLLFMIGLVTRKSQFQENNSTDIIGPSLKQLVLTTAFAFLCILLATKIFHVYAPHITKNITKKLLASSIIPLLILILAFLFQHYSPYISKLGVFLNKRRLLQKAPHSVISLLITLPIIITAVISVFTPFFASRHMLIFTPYLLIILSKGIVYIYHAKMRRFSLILFMAIVLFLVNIHYSSIEYNKSRPMSPNDHKGLAQQWIPHIKDSDLIFVQRHWATTPIFYYLKGDQYHFIGQNYSQEILKNPDSRVWVLSFEGLPIDEKIKNALVGYEALMTVEALRIKADLYGRPNAGDRTLTNSDEVVSKSYNLDF